MTCSCWHKATTWIERNGGFIHPSLQYDPIHRRVIYAPSLSSSSSSSSCPNRHDASTSSPVVVLEAGTTILEIPEACLLTLHSAEKDANFGKSLFGAVHSIDKDNDDDGGGESSDGIDGDGHGNGGLYHDAQDVILALYLAYLREQLLKDEENERHDVGEVTKDEIKSSLPSTSTDLPVATTSNPWLFYEPYIATLPLLSSSNTTTPGATTSPSSSNNKSIHHPPQLPRQWSSANIQHRLGGTSLYHRVQNEQRGIRREYDLVKHAWRSKHGCVATTTVVTSTTTTTDNSNASPSYSNPHSTDGTFPSFDNYDSMMAIVTSRGFANLGYDGVDALVPILDLLDHIRGRGNDVEEEEVAVRLVVTDVDQDDAGTTTIRRSNGESDVKEEQMHINGQKDECSSRSDDESSTERMVDASGYGDKEFDHHSLEKPRVGPDIRYCRFDVDDDRINDESGKIILSKRQKTTTCIEQPINGSTVGECRRGGSGGVRVTTSRTILPGSILQMTYGAKGNATLLGRYGFCIPNNLEPDGSCNDVLEIKINENAPPVKLQRGPKSYAYGPFINALELCYDHANHRERDVSSGYNNNGTRVDDRGRLFDDGDMNNFLDSCDNELDDEDDTADNESSDAEDDFGFGDTDTSCSRYNSMMNDIRAIDALKDILLKARSGLVNNPLAKLLKGTTHGSFGDVVEMEERYCSILIRSEIQTVDFFLALGSECRRRLVQHIHELQISDGSSEVKESLTKNDIVGLNNFILTEPANDQVIAIAKAFEIIRYPPVVII